MTTCHDDILAQLPHQPPFRFVTCVTALKPGHMGRAIWRVTGTETFFQGHFPGRPLVPGVLITEALAQWAGLVCFAPADGSSSVAPLDGRLAQVEMRFMQSVAPPADIELTATVERSMGRLAQCQVEAEHAGVVVAKGMLVVAVAETLPEEHTKEAP